MLALSFALSVTAAPTRARACAPCGAGDSIARIAGAEQPFPGRARLGAVLVHTAFADSESRVFEQRLVLGGSVALDDTTLLLAALPLVWREVEDATLARDTSLGIGDLELRVRVTLARDRSFAPAHRLVLELGTRVPTAPRLTRPGGILAPLESQTGTGAPEPLLGLGWLSQIDETTLALALQGAFPMTGFGGWRNGPALRGSAAVQWQPLPELALRGTLDARFEGPAEQRGQRASEGGLVMHLGAGLVLVPSADIVGHLGVRVPVVTDYDAASGRWDGVTIEAGVAIDV